MQYLGESWLDGPYFLHIPGPQSQSKSVEDSRWYSMRGFLAAISDGYSQVYVECLPNGICRCSAALMCLFTGSCSDHVYAMVWKWPSKMGHLARMWVSASPQVLWMNSPKAGGFHCLVTCFYDTLLTTVTSQTFPPQTSMLCPLVTMVIMLSATNEH